MDLRKNKYIWLIGLVITLAVIIIPIVVFASNRTPLRDDPQAGLVERPPHTDHSALLTGPYESGSDVTAACLECHEEAAFDVMKTVHWTWESEPVEVPGHDGLVTTIGKKNQINNFCIGSQGNEKKCMSCHAGYGWEDDRTFDFNNPLNVDCLICHADTNIYAKGDYGYPAEGVDLAAAAQSVRRPERDNCGYCHFDGGGGNGVKHGDLDRSLVFPSENVDVHMGSNDMECIDCHQTEDHLVKGRMISVSVEGENQVYCTDCHSAVPHEDERLNEHTDAVACQTCHIPSGAVKDPTKMFWDWSTAGQDLPEDHLTYLKIKGSFVYENDIKPTYQWYDETVDYRYLLGDKIDPSQPTLLNPPGGDISDPDSKIFPFKIHVAKQPFDTVNNVLIQPLTAGEGGFWTTFDWPSALKLGAERTGIDYSGEYGFAETWMWWPITHMVKPASEALQCAECHSDDGRLDWKALGYPGDPMVWGGRDVSNP